jgi:carbohydrate-selective porin OprB
VVVGFVEHEQIAYHTPAEPAKIHAFVALADSQQEKRFFSAHQYVHMLYQAPFLTMQDDLLLSILRMQKQKNVLNKEQLLMLIDTYNTLIANDYRRLKLFIQRLG